METSLKNTILPQPALQTGKARYRKTAALTKRGTTKPLLNKRKKAQLEKWKS